MSSAYHPLHSFPDSSMPADRTVVTRSGTRGTASVGSRVATTGTLFGVLVIAAVAMILSPAEPTSQPPAVSSRAAPAAPVAPAPLERLSGASVKIIGATPRSEDCERQVWPYIESRCLVRAAAKPRVAETTGAAPIDAPAIPAASDRTPAPRIATARLQLPPRPAAAADAWAGDAIEQPYQAKPRRRASRRAYRSHGWGGRQAFPFRF